jgi:hypothetical protein
MERNADGTFGATGGQSSPTPGSGSPGSGGMGTTGASDPEARDYSTGSSGTSNIGGSSGQTRTADQARATAQNKLGQVKDKARELQSTLADRLDAGAQKIRQRQHNVPLAGATEAGSVAAETTNRMANVQDSVAHGMEQSADWLRNGDLRSDIERQVRENPGRSLLIALGLGYVIGKAFRSGDR